jgi:hypothetical protein
MDTYLYHTWQSVKPPFAEDTLYCKDELPLYELACLLSALVSSLSKEHGDAPLLHMADWHEHDGYITPKQIVEWELLGSIVASPEMLFKKCLEMRKCLEMSMYD